jgi:hypothetical protein
MVRPSSLWPNENGTTAAEFALVLPFVLLFLLGIIDAGRFMWEYNRAEKATQAGARMAAVTDVISPGLATTTYVGQTVGGTTLTQGDRIPAAALGTISCTQSGCSCASGTCPSLGTINSTSFTNIVTRMKYMFPQIQAANVTIEYRGSGLGFAGDPNGSEVSPLVRITLSGLQFRPITFLLFKTLTMPSFSTTLTAEDLSGSNSN